MGNYCNLDYSPNIYMINVIDDYGREIKLTKESYLYDSFTYLSEHLPNFDEYLFIFWGNNSDGLPMSRHIPHPKKVLIWESNENKVHNLTEIKPHFHHIFANYCWDADNVTSLPLGYHTYVDDWTPLPMKERLFNVSFTGCLNRNRIQLASEITQLSIPTIGFGLRWMKRQTLFILNTIASYKHPIDYFRFNPDFNKGLSVKDYHFFLRHTKIALVPRGWVNTETFRLYEAMKWGCVVIAEEQPDREYYKDLPIIQVSDWNTGYKIARDLMGDLNELERISTETIRMYNEQLSGGAVGKLMCKALMIK